MTYTRLAHATKGHLVPDDLHQRYQAASRAHREHTSGCPACTDRARCPAGERLWTVFERLQDAYLARQRSKRAR